MRAKRNTRNSRKPRNSRKQSPSKPASANAQLDAGVAARLEEVGIGRLMPLNRRGSGKPTKRCRVEYDKQGICDFKLPSDLAGEIVQAYGTSISTLYEETTLNIAITKPRKDEKAQRSVQKGRVSAAPLKGVLTEKKLELPVYYNVVRYRNCYLFVREPEEMPDKNLDSVDCDLTEYRLMQKDVAGDKPYLRTCASQGDGPDRLTFCLPRGRILEETLRTLHLRDTGDRVVVQCDEVGSIILINPSFGRGSVAVSDGQITMNGFREGLQEVLGKHKKVFYDKAEELDGEFVVFMATGEFMDK